MLQMRYLFRHPPGACSFLSFEQPCKKPKTSASAQHFEHFYKNKHNMKRPILILSLLFATYCRLFSMPSEDTVSIQNWKFMKGEVENGQSVELDDGKWESVVVPHDWAIGKPFDMNIDFQAVKVD